MSSDVINKTQSADNGLLNLVNRLKDSKENNHADNSLLNEEALKLIPKNAEVKVSIDNSELSAFVVISEPENGGEDITEDKLLFELKNSNVVFGIDFDAVKNIVSHKIYNKSIEIAKGTLPINGLDGTVEDYFSRENNIKFVEAKDGSVNFKNLKSFVAVDKNSLICRRTNPTLAQHGKTVTGKVLKGKDGVPVILPLGHNTYVTEDGTELRASVYGSLEFINSKFQVSTTYNVHGNVDNSVGNIDFPGDVIVQGDVYEGFSVKAQGNIVVRGVVEGASITADGNIELSNGINGMLKGVITSKKSIKTRYIENCTVNAGENITTETIINSNVSCGGDLMLQGRRGAIIGGTCSVGNKIEAKEIGTKIHTATNIILGITSEVIKERYEIEKKLKELKEEAHVIALNISYLEDQIKDLPPTDKKVEVYNLLRRKSPVNMMSQSRLQKKLEIIDQKINNINNCSLRCSYIYPPTKISFGNTTTVIRNEAQRCIFTLEQGEIICRNF